MRQNLPITQREYPFPEGTTLMSTTDVQSHIRYANAAFVAVSGFERDELIGQPHNLVRHPDMPREAFADMWATLKAGQSWTALVKNRRKDGDHYWVRANATAVRRNGQVTGFLSVRTKPCRDEVQAAESLYARFRDGAATGLAFRRGVVVRTGWRSPLSWLKTMSLATRVRLGCMVAALPPAVLSLVGANSVSGALLDVAALTAGMVLASSWLTRQIVRPVQQVAAQAQSVASGQPDDSVQIDRIDEIGLLMRSVNQAGLNLRSLLDDVSVQSGGLGQASQEIAAGNLDLSNRTEEAASSLQQTASSMEQMTGSVRQSAESAQEANRLAESAGQAAALGGEVVGTMQASMERISASSKRIADIIGTIDGIAFQTNILALNAAVEAARAGEQGRGFAVVASEVRALAQRSATAAREIKTLVGQSIEVVEGGHKQAGEAGAAMQRIVSEVQRVGALIADISAAAREQSQGIDEVNGAVAQLDRMTQQNAALVEEGAAAAQSLRQQAGALTQAVEAFRA